MCRVGTPGNISCVIYKGTETIPFATSVVRISTDIITVAVPVYVFDFNPAVEMVGGVTYRIVFSAASGANATAYYYLSGSISLDTDANSLTLVRWGNRLTILTGTTWADNTAGLITFGIILDGNAGPFVSSGTGTGFKTAVGDLGILGVRRFGQF